MLGISELKFGRRRDVGSAERGYAGDVTRKSKLVEKQKEGTLRIRLWPR